MENKAYNLTSTPHTSNLKKVSTSSMSIIDIYFVFWAFVLPISSVLVFPSIQGTTPAYLFALLVVPLSIFLAHLVKGKIYIKGLVTFIFIFITLNTISQFGLALSRPDFGTASFIDSTDRNVLFRSSMFTQSLYMLASASTFFFVKSFYHKKWNKFIFSGSVLLAAYGIYEFLFFIIFHQNGDFLSNRTFNEGTISEISGSLFQTIEFGSITIQRLKSLTGEPSMYAFTILPFWIFAIHEKKTLIHIILFITLLLSTASTAFIGIIVYLFIRMFYFGLRDRYLRLISIILILAFLINGELISIMFNELILDKLMLSNSSALDRSYTFVTSLDLFFNSSVINQLFGIGFGYIRSTDMFSTILANNGIIGFLIWTALFLYPVIKLDNCYKNIGTKSAIVVVYVTMMVSVPEYSYLSTWLFLGIAYSQLQLQNKMKLEAC